MVSGCLGVISALWCSLSSASVPEVPYLSKGYIPRWPANVDPPVNPDASENITAEGPIVRIAHGPVQGVLRGGDSNKTVAWWGIPFAQPPVGELRFRAPQQLTRTWTDPLQATKIPASCIGAEDCLYLNVFARASVLSNGSAPVPVMYWIYGGGFTTGSNYELGLYDGQHLCQSHGMIVVAVNYRLGNLGFMALDALRGEDPSGSTGNYGVQDQTLGLKWVNKNIAAFGGNPSLVTIFGESAGGFSVMWHLVSPSSSGLFHAAIMESGTSQISFFYQHYDDAAAYGEDTATIVNCPGSLGAAAQLKCLRALPMQTILHGAGSELGSGLHGAAKPADHSPMFPIMPVGPVIDGTAIGTADTPMKLVEAGKFNKVPLILGANENGGTIFEPMLPQIVPGGKWPASLYNGTMEKAFDYMFQNSSAGFQNIYKTSEYVSAHWPEDALISRMIRDLVFMCPLRQLATAFAKQGLPAYMYVFHFDYGVLIDNILHLGDFHAGELPFVFKNWLWAVQGLAPDQDAQLMSDIMSCKWASFAYTHDPNGGSDETKWPPGCQEINKKYSSWPVFDTRDRLFYSLKQEPEVRQIMSQNYYPDDLFPRDAKCDFIDAVSASFGFQRGGRQGAPLVV